VPAADVASGLTEVAVERGAAMIALAAGEHGAVHALLFGGTTDRLARAGRFPLWVVTRPMLRADAPS
jgi:nucleotide-binding universal stress UspA family protein